MDRFLEHLQNHLPQPSRVEMLTRLALSDRQTNWWTTRASADIPLTWMTLSAKS